MLDRIGDLGIAASTPRQLVTQYRLMVESVAGTHGEPLYSVEDLFFVNAGESLKMRLYKPREGVLPVLLFFYGGGFVSGGLDAYDTVLRTVANRTGWAIVAPQYRLAPEYPFPAAPEDCYAALLSLVARAPSLGLDPRRIVVTGESSGGTLTIVTGLMARDRGAPTLAGLIPIEPATDMTAHLDPGLRRLYPSLTENDGKIISLRQLAMQIELYTPNPADRANPYAVPSRAKDLSGLPPTLIITAECDPLRDEGEDFANRLRQAGVAAGSVCLKGAIHGMLANMNMLPGARAELLLRIGEFLGRI
jgi:acetyl esterase